MYSPPRIAPKARGEQTAPGISFDLKTGWDLTDGKQVQEMWRKLEEEDPIIVILSPPCTAFSQLQEWNFRKMSLEKAVAVVKIGVYHLNLAAKIYVVFEQPKTARSWLEPPMQRLLQLGFIRENCDMCEYGLKVDGNGLNKKPTGIMTNPPCIPQKLSRKCRHNHFHVPTLHGLPKKAQVYPQAFCEATIKGLKQQMRQDEGFWTEGPECWLGEGADEEEDEDMIEDLARESAAPVVPAEERGEGESSYKVTKEEQAAVHKLRKNIGHPAQSDMIRFMRAARVKPEVIRWAAKEFHCPTCEAKAKPKLARPGTIPRSFQPNKVIGIDLLYVPEVGGGTFPAVSVVDWGTNFQMVQRVESKSPEEVWRVVESMWFRIFGPPQGREFMSDFGKKAMAHGIVIYQTAARAPWQQGKTERHGAHFKTLLEKARSEVVVTSREELQVLMIEVEQAKNRYSNRSGFSPVQRQIGHWPRVPGSIMSDQGKIWNNSWR